MFNFGNADESKRQAISAADGAVLITAGPGTGKTFTLVQRTLYLIKECKVKPENIFIAITPSTINPNMFFKNFVYA